MNKRELETQLAYYKREAERYKKWYEELDESIVPGGF
jgi:hypothetical protein